MGTPAEREARNTLPPRLDRPFKVRVPKPGRLPTLPTEEEIAQLEEQLQDTETGDHGTVRPAVGLRAQRQSVQRAIVRVEYAINSGQLGERDLHDAIINLHRLRHTLKMIEHPVRHAAAEFERVLQAERIAQRFAAALR